MNTIEHKETYYVDTTRPKFKIQAINGQVTDIELYSSNKADYEDISELSKIELKNTVSILISEYLKLDCSNILD